MNNLIEVFTGFEHTVKMVQMRLLNEVGIQSLIKNDFDSGIIAGFVGGSMSSVSLFVKESDSQHVLTLLEEWEMSGKD
ncbi:MAG: DUF2007 domain-containing protein [Bacteroidales bacterium]|nr:DUF2007 domain-containing protein [Bacteroidales bacterium]